MFWNHRGITRSRVLNGKLYAQTQISEHSLDIFRSM